MTSSYTPKIKAFRAYLACFFIPYFSKATEDDCIYGLQFITRYKLHCYLSGNYTPLMRLIYWCFNYLGIHIETV